MSLIKAIRHQLGLSVTPANNFTLTAEADNGTMKLARGNAGATTQDIMTVDANGKVGFPQTPIINSGPAFSAHGSAAQSIPTNAFTKIAYPTEEFDTANAYDAPNSRFQPQVPGYYQINAMMSYSTSAAGIGQMFLYKNGLTFKAGNQITLIQAPGLVLSALVFMNGTTDFLEIFGWHNAGAANNGGALSALYAFQGHLVRGA